MSEQPSKTPRTDEGGPEVLKVTLMLAERASYDPRVKSTFRSARERIEALERENTRLLADRKRLVQALQSIIDSGVCDDIEYPAARALLKSLGEDSRP